MSQSIVLYDFNGVHFKLGYAEIAGKVDHEELSVLVDPLLSGKSIKK